MDTNTTTFTDKPWQELTASSPVARRLLAAAEQFAGFSPDFDPDEDLDDDFDFEGNENALDDDLDDDEFDDEFDTRPPS